MKTTAPFAIRSITFPVLRQDRDERSTNALSMP
jgi:hypothetical protein